MDRIERSVTLPTGTEEAWDLLTRPDDLGQWLGGEVSFDAVPGSIGELVETDGGRRRVAVDDVELGARITWRWWHDDAPESASGVEITLVPVDGGTRSEEHTSELQSLMRISYAVFCLKKKKTK